MLKRIWIIALLLGPIGCSAKSPNWTSQPVKDSVSHFYSVGSGKTLDLARKNALDTLSARLIVNVKNTTTTSVDKQDNAVSQGYSSKSRYDTEELAFFKVDIVKSHQEKAEYFAMISANKSQVFQAIYDKLNQELSPLLTQPSNEEGKIVANGLKVDALLPRYQKYISLLKSYRQDTSLIDSQLLEFNHNYADIKRNTSFEVFQSSDETHLRAMLTNKLGNSGFSQNSSQNHLKAIIVGPERQQAEQNGLFAVKLSGSILYTFNNELIYTLPLQVFEYGDNKRQVESRVDDALNSLLAE